MMARRGRHRRSQRAETRNYRARRSDRQETIQRFLIVCEGEKTEPSYLGSFRGPALVLDIRGFGINPRKLVDKALELGEEGEYEQVWCVFDRDECRRLRQLIPQSYRTCCSCSDFWEAYQLAFDAATHRAVGKETGETAHVERWNNTLRQRLARFVRKTLSFSKSDHFHQLALQLFIHDYNLQCLSVNM